NELRPGAIAAMPEQRWLANAGPVAHVALAENFLMARVSHDVLYLHRRTFDLAGTDSFATTEKMTDVLDNPSLSVSDKFCTRRDLWAQPFTSVGLVAF